MILTKGYKLLFLSANLLFLGVPTLLFLTGSSYAKENNVNLCTELFVPQFASQRTIDFFWKEMQQPRAMCLHDSYVYEITKDVDGLGDYEGLRMKTYLRGKLGEWTLANNQEKDRNDKYTWVYYELKDGNLVAKYCLDSSKQHPTCEQFSKNSVIPSLDAGQVKKMESLTCKSKRYLILKLRNTDFQDYPWCR